MKRLLTIFSAFVLGSGPILTTTGCSKHDEMYFSDDGMYEVNRDLETLNTIMKETRENIKDWWRTRTEININRHVNEHFEFMKLVTKLKDTNNELMLTGSEIYQWTFLNQFIFDLKKVFNTLNQKFINQYSNFYYDTMPLSLKDSDIRITLKLINFHNLEKLNLLSNEPVEAILINFDVNYLVKFKEILQPEQTKETILITNNLFHLNRMRVNLTNYFVTFIDDLFRKQNYQIIETLNQNFNNIDQSNTIFQLIIDELKARKINFKIMNEPLVFNTFYDVHAPEWDFEKEKDSVLAWAGEGYDPKKLTPKKFLEFYRKRYFEDKIAIENNYYVKANITSFIPNDFIIENLLFKNKKSEVKLKNPIKVLTAKKVVDQRLNDFAKKIMNFWNYYKIETYNNKIVFKVTKRDFETLFNNLQRSFKPNSTFIDNLIPIFRYLSRQHGLKLDLNSKTNNGWMNFISKKESFILNFLWRPNSHNYYPNISLSFLYNSFSYGLFINPVPTGDKTNHIFIQSIEFDIL